MPRISNRRYKSIRCKNADCKKSFEPHDRRQIYCGVQCRINYNNDKRTTENNTRFIDEKQSRKNNKILELIWKRLVTDKQKIVSNIILEWERFKFDSQALLRKNIKSGQNILWFYDYGIELLDKSQSLFEIHKRNN